MPRAKPPTRPDRTFSRSSVHGQVAHEIGLKIVRGELAPGSFLPTEEELSIRLGVSRTALREAIKLMAAKGLVQSRRKAGTRVRPRAEWNMLDPDMLAWQLAAAPVERFIKDLFELRLMIEPQGARLAALRRTDEDLVRLNDAYAGLAAAGNDADRWEEPDMRFHQSLLSATHNELMEPLGALIETALAMGFRLSNATPGGPRHALGMHKAILDAVAAGDGEAAFQRMVELLDNTMVDVHRALDWARTGEPGAPDPVKTVLAAALRRS
jgi:DNA-binding FadR family transcriptional regulator